MTLSNSTDTRLLGIDIGSTTAKMAVVDESGAVLYSDYRRHNADVVGTLIDMVRSAGDVLGNTRVSVSVTGSAGIGVSERYGLPFVQEVIAAAEVVRRLYPDVRTLVDVGGEDSKMVFFDERMRPDIRMNGNCAGGTGAFIDQMATLLDLSMDELDEKASKHERVHTIASRCGVFAKTDIQNLLCRRIPKEDIAASIFHAVAIQTVSSLSRGYYTRPRVMFCGGPLTFLPMLRKSFIEVMEVGEEHVIIPDHSELIPAIGAALYTETDRMLTDISGLIALIGRCDCRDVGGDTGLDPLFRDEEEFLSWESTRMVPVDRGASMDDLCDDECFLGIDSGSTTTKILLMTSSGDILFSHYSGNNGDPIEAVRKGLEEMAESREGVDNPPRIVGSCVTGYGEDLIRAAYGMDRGIVETMAHFRAAREFREDVSFILDIGGQDMKAIFIESGIINNIEINEACSSGCGSFIETFAITLGFDVEEFARKACSSERPSDLGTRCTVFMNSKVKQCLREGSSVEDISAGLAYSVVKNCLYKVLKIKDTSLLGKNIVIQGGTFRNPAVHRALEKILERKVICSDMPEMMGAYGAALTAMDGYTAGSASSFIGLDALSALDDMERTHLRCGGCENRCTVTKLKFANGEVFYTGNKCERIFTNSGRDHDKGENLPARKLELLFDRKYEPEGAHPLTIGIPRVLNMYENLPFWNTLLVESGFAVSLSSPSTMDIAQKGSRTIMSDNICFPAKLVNGHILELIERGVDRIFMPMVLYEEEEFGGSVNSYNCPIVYGYPDVIRSSIGSERMHDIPFDTPTVSFRDRSLLKKACWKYLRDLGLSRSRFNRSFGKALKAQKEYKDKVLEAGRGIIDRAGKKDRTIILLLTRPYQIDPLVNHRIPEMISALGADVITEDAVPREGDGDISNTQVLTQWEYPNRIFHAVNWAVTQDNVEVIHLNSFGCGPDAVVYDEARSILSEHGKNHTLIRIDEMSSPGSVKLRLRSMMESLDMRGRGVRGRRSPRMTTKPFTIEDNGRKILVPTFNPFIDPLIEVVFGAEGFNVETLPPPDRESVEMGLKYVNNDICYPATIVIGDIIKALKSGRYDPSKVVAGITQTGGQCRASSYLSLIKKALVSAGFEDVPVVTVAQSDQVLNQQPGLKFNWKNIAKKAMLGMFFADSLMQMYNSIAVREVNRGDARRLMEKYHSLCCDILRGGKAEELIELTKRAVEEYNRVETRDEDLPVIGFVGEIYVRSNPFGNHGLVNWMFDNGVEVVVPSMFEFLWQYFINQRSYVDGNVRRRDLSWLISYPVDWYIKRYMKRFERIRSGFRYHRPGHDIEALARMASGSVNLVDQFGEGWLIPGEITAFYEQGIRNVLCVQPFGCIANHIIGKGVEKRLKDNHPDLNLLYLDMDAGASEVNLQNRLEFLVRSAKEDMKASS